MTATLKKKSKQALPFKRANTFLADPEAVYLETEPKKKFYSARSVLPYDEEQVVVMLDHGVELEILVVRHEDKAVVVDGRRRTVNLREANRRRAKDGLPPILLRVKVVKARASRAWPRSGESASAR
jgi:hypothetical protein